MAEREREREDDDRSIESNLEALLQKKAGEKPADGPEDADVLDLDDLGRDDQVGTDALAVKALPQQDNEFTCGRCFLVKHRSQLADKKKNVCRDCT